MKIDSAGLQCDLDGLLLDTEFPQRPVYQRIFRDLCGVEVSAADFAWALGKSYEETVHGIDERFGSLPLRDSQVMGEGESLGRLVVSRLREERKLERHSGGVDPMPYAKELLNWADSLSLPRSVSTSRQEDVAHEMLEVSRLLPQIHVVVGRNSEGVRGAKPAPDVFQVAAKRLGVPVEDCWVLEDSPPGVIGAAAAGAKVIYVPDERVAGACQQSRRLAAFTVKDLEEAAATLQRELGGALA